MSPFLVLIIGIAFIVVAVAVVRIHAFVALMLAAIFVGLIAPEIQLLPDEYPQKFISGIQGKSQLHQAIEVAVYDFGVMAGKIALVIVLASIIGQCMMDSGAADMVTRRLLKVTGEKRSGLALLGSGFTLSIPVFFDTVFFLLIPLAKAFRIRTGKNYLLYVMALCTGAIITHSLVAPTPGPLAMAENLKITLGTSIIAGIVFGLPPALIGGWVFAKWLDKRLDIPMRETPGTSLAELERIVRRDDSELPSVWLAILPVILPVLLICSWTVVSTIHAKNALEPTTLEMFRIIGNKNLAMFLSAGIALWILVRQKNLRFRELLPVLEPAIAAAGVIVLITSAGGAFGAMLRHADIQSALESWGASSSGITLLLTAFFISAILKTAQGSSTVAIITTSAIIFGLIKDVPYEQMPYHPIYLFLAIGFGSKVLSWMNDSGFWIVCKLSGFTEKETLKTWSALLAFLGFIGLIEVLIFSQLLPLNTLLHWDPTVTP